MNDINLIRFINQINSQIGLLGITKEIFFNDVILAKNNTITSKQFITKYNELFNGNIANFGNIYFTNFKYSNLTLVEKQDKALQSFLASVRRNSNPLLFGQLKNPNYKKFGSDLRLNVVGKAKVMKKIKKAKTTTYSSSVIYSKKEKYYKNVKGYIGFANKEIKGLKNIWNIDFIKSNKLIGRQEVLLRVKYDLYFYNSKTNKYELFDKGLWITLSSGFTQITNLSELYNDCLKQYELFVWKCSQSKLVVEPERVCTYVIRKSLGI